MWTQLQIVWQKLTLIENKRRLTRRYISRASCKQLYANFCWHSVSSSPQSVAWRPKWDLCCILLLTSNRVPFIPTDLSPNQLLCGGDFRSRARQRNRSCFTDVHFWTWIDANMGRKMNVCIFCSFITQIGFFVIPEICLTASVIHSKLNLITNIERSTLWWL